jgi:Uma2 family endonuclease
MAILVLDPACEAKVRELWPNLDDERSTEVWEGVTVMSPAANNEHQNLVNDLGGVFWLVIAQASLGRVLQGVNLSDRTPNWIENYRNPDVAVYLTANPAVDHGTHYVGGPDFAVEVVSPGETPSAKFAFYAAVGTRELLIVHRDPWRLELFALVGGQLKLAGSSPAVCTSVALGLTFQLGDATPRPRIAVTHPATGGTWSI